MNLGKRLDCTPKYSTVKKIEYIYIHNYRFYLAVAFRICENRELAKDIVQDAFLSVLAAGNDLQSIINLEAYIVTCVKNVAYKRLSKDRRERAMIRDFLQVDKEDDPIPEWLHKFVNRLSGTSRTVIKERYFNDRSQTELATQFHVSRLYLRIKEKEALKILKKYMVEY